MGWDLVTAVNLVFCVIIVSLGYVGYRRKREALPLLIGAAFGLFGISHLLTLLSLSEDALLIAIRGLAYLVVIFALYRFSTQYRPE